MNTKRKFSLLIILFLLVFVIVGCKDKNPDDSGSNSGGEVVDPGNNNNPGGNENPGNTDKPVVEVDNSALVSKVEGKIYYSSPDIPATNTTNDGLSKESPLFIEKVNKR